MSLTKASAWLGTGLALSAIAAYLLFPTQTLQQALPVVANQWPLVTLGLLGLAGLCHLVSTLWAEPIPNVVSESTPLPQTTHFGEWALAAIVLIQVLWQWDTPLGVDENIHAALMGRGEFWSEINPFASRYQQNHVLPQFLSAVSMKVLGVNKWALRLPSILFLVALLSGILFLGRQLLTPFTRGLLLCHLAANQTLVWYMHSMRGYAGMVLVCFIAFLLIYGVTQGHTTKHHRLWLGLCLFASSLMHLFGGIVVCLIFASYLVWAYLNSKQLTAHQTRTLRADCRWFLFSLPVLASIFIAKFLFINKIGDFGSTSTIYYPFLIQALGMIPNWMAKIWLLVTLGFCWLAWQTRKQSYLAIFSVLSGLALYSLISILEVRVFLPRFLLGFVLPWVVVLGQTAGSGQWWHKAVTVGLCLAFPLISASTLYQSKARHFHEFDTFLKYSKAKVGQACVSVSGRSDLAIWTRDFYFHGQAKNCQAQYNLHFPVNRYPRSFDRPPHIDQVLLKTPGGMELSQLAP